MLAETRSTVTVATGAWNEDGPGEDAQVVDLEREGRGWVAAAWGDCSALAPVLGRGQQWVQIDSLSAGDPSSTELTVQISERACAGGRDPRPFLATPEGYSTCIGSTPVSQPLRLSEPLGEHPLLDGSGWPARFVTSER